MRLICYSQLSIQQPLIVPRHTASCSWLQQRNWWVEWADGFFEQAGWVGQDDRDTTWWEFPWRWDSVEGKDHALLHLYWTKLWWRNWGTWEENQNASPSSVPSTCHAICCHCQCHLGKSLLGWSTRDCSHGKEGQRWHPTSLKPQRPLETTGRAVPTLTRCSTTITMQEMAEWHLTALTYVIPLCIIVFFISQLRVNEFRYWLWLSGY